MGLSSGFGTDASGQPKSLEEQFDWQLDHDADPPRWVGGIAGYSALNTYTVITSTTVGGDHALDVNVVQTVGGGTIVQQGAKDASVEAWIVDLTKVGGTSFALGQQLAAASLPIVLTASQLTTLTPPAAITGFATETTLGDVKTSLAALDNSVDGNYLNVNLNLAGTDVLQAVTGTDSTGGGIPSQAILAQFDDTTPSSVTENRFGNLRMSSRRVLYVEGTVASDTAIAANPLTVGARASLASPTDVSADGDAVNLWATREGATVVSNPVGTRTTGTKDLASASTTYRIDTSSTWVSNFWVQAKGTNTGTITWGSSSTYASNYMELRPGQMIYLGTVDISLIYYGSTAAGDDINYSYTA